MHILFTAVLNASQRYLQFAAVLLLASVLVACGGSEARQAKYLASAQKHFDNDNFEKAKIDAKNSLQINADHADSVYLMALIEEKEQNFRQMFGNLSRVVELDKQHTEARIKLAQLYMLSKQNEQAQEQVDAILEYEPESIDARIVQGNIYLKDEKPDAAIEEAKAVLEKDPGNVGAIGILTAVYSAENPDLAMEYINEGLAKQNKEATLQLLKIHVLEKQNKAEDVVKEYNNLIANHPETIFYRYRLVNYFETKGRIGDAAVVIEQAIIDFPENEDVKLGLSRLYLNNKQPKKAKKALQKLIAEDPDNMQLRRGLGDLLIASKENVEAKTEFEKIIDDDSEGEAGQYARGRLIALAVADKEVDKAKKLLAEMLEIEPENSQGLITEARFMLAEKDLDGAITNLRTVVRNEPESQEALTLLARAQEASGAKDLALDNYKQLVNVAPQNVEALFNTGRLLRGQKDNKGAEAMLRAAVKVDPAHVASIGMLVTLLGEQKKWEDALEIAELGTVQVGLVEYLKGMTYLRQEKPAEATTQLKASIAAEPRSIEPLTMLVRTLIQTDQKAEALSFLAEHVKQNPKQAHSRELLGSLYVSMEQPQKAIEQFNKLLEIAPKRLSGYQLLAKVYKKQGKEDQALAVFDNALKKYPKSVALITTKADFLNQTGDYLGAREAYENAIKKSPTAVVVKNNLAILLADQFADPASLARAAELTADFADSNNPVLIDTAGWVLYKQGKIDDAIPLLEQAINLGADAPEYHYHLGMAYADEKKNALARQHLRSAVVAGAEKRYWYATAKKALDKL